MKLILASYLEAPFVDAKNFSEEIKNTLCDSDKAFYIESIIFTNQIHSTNHPVCTVLGALHRLQTHLLRFQAAPGAVPAAGGRHAVTVASDGASTAARLCRLHASRTTISVRHLPFQWQSQFCEVLKRHN